MASKFKDRILKMLREMIPVILGVLIALLVNGWKENLDDRRYLNRMLGAIENEVESNLEDIEKVMGRHKVLLDTLQEYREDTAVSLAEIVRRANGLQSATIKNAAWQSLNNSRLELVDYEMISVLTRIDQNKDLLQLKMSSTLDFLFNNLHGNSTEDKETFSYHVYNLLDSEQTLIRIQEEFQELREG